MTIRKSDHITVYTF